VDDIGSNIKRALDSKAPALVEVPITRDVSVAAAKSSGGGISRCASRGGGCQSGL
jgi:hypothetical protein